MHLSHLFFRGKRSVNLTFIMAIWLPLCYSEQQKVSGNAQFCLREDHEKN